MTIFVPVDKRGLSGMIKRSPRNCRMDAATEVAKVATEDLSVLDALTAVEA